MMTSNSSLRSSLADIDSVFISEGVEGNGNLGTSAEGRGNLGTQGAEGRGSSHLPTNRDSESEQPMSGRSSGKNNFSRISRM